MRIALPTNEELVSTVFDFADRLVLMDIRTGEVFNRGEADFVEKLASLRVARLRSLGVDTLICGAISEAVAMMIQHSGIELVSGIRGHVSEVVGAYIDGELHRACYRLPGFDCACETEEE